MRRATVTSVARVATTVISIHALLAESDIMFVNLRVVDGSFLSTLSLRRATSALGGTTIPEVYFYPRSPCGERQHKRQHNSLSRHFYPRSPCGERRLMKFSWNLTRSFLSTLSLRRATNSAYGALDGASISIHALLAESDCATIPNFR